MIAGIEMPTAIDISSVVGLISVGLFTAQILLGLLLSVGYNPGAGQVPAGFGTAGPPAPGFGG